MKLRFIAIFVVIAAAAAFVQAKAVNPRAHLAKQLGLSEAQRTELKAIRQQTRQKVQPVTGELRQNRQALRAAVKAGDTAQIQSLSKTQGDLRGQALAIRSQARAQIYASLTDEQRQKLDARRARVAQRLARRQANRPATN